MNSAATGNAAYSKTTSAQNQRSPQQPEEPLNPIDDLVDYTTEYVRQNPGTAALWCFGVGFIVGWKLKPW